MCRGNSDGHGLLGTTRGCGQVKTEVILDIETIMASNIEICDEGIDDTLLD